MLLPTLNPETAFAITALSSWALVGLLWVVGRSYQRQGVAWIMGSLSCFGIGYLLIALSNALPTQAALLSSYAILSLGSALASVGIRRFLLRPWSAVDNALLALALVLPLLWAAIAGGEFAQRVRLTNLGFVIQIVVLCTVIWRGRQAIAGNGWKAMLVGAIIQGLSVLPFALPGAPPSTVDHIPQSLPEQVVAWGLCIVMFLNLQLSALSFLMMLQDRRNDEERQAAEIDVLTQLPNRRSLERQLLATLPLVYRQGGSVAIVLLDIDHFKQVNDNYGHDVGDQVLQHVAGLLRAEVRQGELLARYGGEEFVIILPYANVDAASTLAARVVDKVRKAPIAIQGELHTMTVSAGVHVQRLAAGQRQLPATAQWPDWVREADGAMYEAKHAGRNRFVVSQTSHQ